jgi:hypothetical protein
VAAAAVVDSRSQVLTLLVLVVLAAVVAAVFLIQQVALERLTLVAVVAVAVPMELRVALAALDSSYFAILQPLQFLLALG